MAIHESAEPEKERSGRMALIVLCCLLLGVAVGWLISGKGARVATPNHSLAEGSVTSNVGTEPEGHSGKPSFSRGPSEAGVAARRQTKAQGVDDDRLSQSASGARADITEYPATVDPVVDQSSVANLNSQMWADADTDALTDFADGGPKQVVDAVSSTPEADEEQAPSIAPPIDLAAAIEEAAQVLGETRLMPHPAVLLENLSQQQKDQVPTIVYSAHGFNAEGQSTVTLNQQQLGVGQRAGLIEVREILPDSVILKINGVVFRLRALNTWVNL
jgi:hypothetical protein